MNKNRLRSLNKNAAKPAFDLDFDLIETNTRYKYKLNKILGSGSFGVVYLAEIIPKFEEVLDSKVYNNDKSFFYVIIMP